MRWPWSAVTRSAEERAAADLAVDQTRSHIRVLVNELLLLSERIEDKARRLASDR